MNFCDRYGRGNEHKRIKRQHYYERLARCPVWPWSYGISCPALLVSTLFFPLSFHPSFFCTFALLVSTFFFLSPVSLSFAVSLLLHPFLLLHTFYCILFFCCIPFTAIPFTASLSSSIPSFSSYIFLIFVTTAAPFLYCPFSMEAQASDISLLGFSHSMAK